MRQIRRLLGVSESKANLHRHRGNHMQTLTILGSTVKSPVDICPAGSPTPAKPEVVFFSGAIAVRFFSWGGGWRGVRHAFVPASFHSVRIAASSKSLPAHSRLPPGSPKPFQDASQGTPRPLKLHHPCQTCFVVVL